MSFTVPRSAVKHQFNSHLHVLRPEAPLSTSNKVQPKYYSNETIVGLCIMCQMVVIGEWYVFYFGIFICCATL